MSHASRYARTQKETASKERLMVMLFEAALRDMRQASQALEEGRRRAAADLLAHATDIVTELSSVLDRTRAPELCDQLQDVYRFVLLRLLDASLRGEASLVREAERAFAPLVDAFSTAVNTLAAPAAAVGDR